MSDTQDGTVGTPTRNAPTGITADDASTWPLGSNLVVKEKTIFPQVRDFAATTTQPLTDSMFNDKSITLHIGERVRLLRKLRDGRYIIAHHASGAFLISSSERFSPIKA